MAATTAETGADSALPATSLDDLGKAMTEFERQGIESLPPLSDKVEEFWVTIPLPDGWESRTKVVRPKHENCSPGNKRPLVVLFHGGGFAVGSPNMVTRPAREIAETFHAVVACPSYKLIGPDTRFPEGVKSAWEVLVHLSQHAERDWGASLAGPGGAFIVGGLSAGASIAAVVAGIDVFGDRGEVAHEPLASPITGVFLNCPLLLTEEIVPAEYKAQWTSREDNKNSPNLGAGDVDQIVKGLQPDLASPWFSPFGAASGDRGTQLAWSRFPPVYAQVGQLDPLRDDGSVFCQFVKDHGAKSELFIIPNEGHAAWCVLPWRSESYPLIGESTMKGITWLLGENYHA